MPSPDRAKAKTFDEIFPVNYGVEGRIIVFRTGAGTKLNEVPTRSVAIEVDGWDPESGIGWSVVAKGRAEEVTKPSEMTGRHFRVPPPRRERD